MDNHTNQPRLRYHLENNAPVDLIEFTRGLQCLHDEYVRYAKTKGEAHAKARLSIYKVEEGSIVFELAEVLPPVIAYLGSANTIIQFGEYLNRMVTGLVKGNDLPPEGRNKKSLNNLHDFIQPLASNPDSKLGVTVINGNVTYENCTFNINSTEGNALQNIANSTKEKLEEETPKLSESKDRVLLRLMQIDKAQESKHDKGVIEYFDKDKKKLLFDNDEIKREFTESDENFFKYLYEVDATALYNNGRIVAYRITKVHSKFDPNEE